MFVLRQINNKINTMVVSMSVICLMLFMTISILSSSLALRNTMQRELIEMTPVDLNLYKTANLPESYKKYGVERKTTKQQRDDSRIPIIETLKKSGLDLNVLKDIIEIPIYASSNLTWNDFLGNKREQIKEKYPMLAYDTAETIVKLSDYNKIAKLYGMDQYELKDNEYIMLCDFTSMQEIRNEVLAEGGNPLTIAGKQYKTKYKECKDGFVVMSTSHTNTGIILVPDNCPLTEDSQEQYFLAANYNATTEEEKEKINEMFSSGDSGFIQNLAENGLEIDGFTKIGRAHV